MNNLEKFLNLYGNEIADNSTVNLDIDSVIRDVSTNIIDPNTDNPDINRLYQRGIALKKEVGNDLVPRLKILKEDKLHEIISFIEQLNSQLNKEYEEEVRKGIEYGIYDRSDKKSV